MMDFDALNALAYALMGRRKSHVEREIGAAYSHGKRVAHSVILLREIVTPDDSHDDVLRVAGMFHDIGKGLEPHNEYGAYLAKKALSGLVGDKENAEIARLIAAHCDRHPYEDTYDVFARLLQDADLLDHFGSCDIWLHFNYYARREGSADEALKWWLEEDPQRISRHRTLLNFEVSKAIYDEKIAFKRAFIKRFQTEMAGEFVTAGKENK